ncbi:Proton-dependent oligopeptide transporter family [Dillenia turbinata]|uniref:Proton-dependent oligopeptide transporter family n=1 Tax=Dillenia turbinata TaxID=194707 RepID=A0AAN8WAW1_9MAGN
MGGYVELAKKGNGEGSGRSDVSNTQEGYVRLNRPGEKGKMQSNSLDPKVEAQFAAGKGGYRTVPFIIANESFERTADVAAHVNLWAYMTERYNYTLARASTLLFLWGGMSHFLPTFGAFISDTYLGRYNVIAAASVLSILGMGLLWLTDVVKPLQPKLCHLKIKDNCDHGTATQLGALFLSFALMSFGSGGIRAISISFGADQIDRPQDPTNKRRMQSFLNLYYASVGIAIGVGVTILVWIQEEIGWGWGFGVPVLLMLISTVAFFVGSHFYVKKEPKKSLLTGFAKVISAYLKKKHLSLPPNVSDGQYLCESEAEFSAPTERLRFLNKACLIIDSAQDLNPDGSATDTWNLCTVQQVEELKALIKIIPIWSACIMMSVAATQRTFPNKQARSMDRRIIPGSNFEVPAASFNVFTVLTMTIWVSTYDRLIVPFVAKYTKYKHGIPIKQQMAVGLVFTCMATTVAACVERMRRAKAISEALAEKTGKAAIVHVSAAWLIPQYCLFGLAEGFNSIGQINFYYSQFPKSMSSIGISLHQLEVAVGNLLGSALVEMVDAATKTGGKTSWLGDMINQAHYDYYYWILTGLGILNICYYLVCSSYYGPADRDEEDDGHRLH